MSGFGIPTADGGDVNGTAIVATAMALSPELS